MAKRRGESKPAYPAEKARGGEIILRTRMRRIIFFAGLVGIVILVIAMRFVLWS